jgi:hypothetical protein
MVAGATGEVRAEIDMQEDQIVAFQPMYVDGPQPWHTRLFLLYLLAVLIVFVVRIVRLATVLWNLKKTEGVSGADSFSAYGVETASLFKALCALTFLVSLLECTWSTANLLLLLRAEHSSNVHFVLARIGDGLVGLAFGLVICVTLYGAGMMVQARGRGRKDRSQAA